METGMGSEVKTGLFVRAWQHGRTKMINGAKNVKKIAKDDPRRVVHSLKVGFALTLVSFIYYFSPLYNGWGAAAMWAVLTVVVVFEYTVGATLLKGLNRVFATLLAGSLATGVNYLADLSGREGEPIILGASVFLIAAASTFARFFPKIKAKYDYGFVIFILTFSLVAVSGYRVAELVEFAHQRLSTIAIGSFACVFISLCICPVWAGGDLHELTAKNIEKLASFLEGFGAECFKTENDRDNVAVTEGEKTFTQGYKSVLNSKSNEDSLSNFARWEPGHGGFGFRHPWKHYQKIGSFIRQCAYCMEALNVCLSSKIQVPIGFQRQIQAPCTKMSWECSEALTELAMGIRTMTKPINAAQHVTSAKTAATELRTALKTALQENSSLLEILPMVTIASLLVETIGHTEKLVESVNELADKAKFKNGAEVGRTPSFLHRATVKPLPVADGSHVVIDVFEPEPVLACPGEQMKERKVEVARLYRKSNLSGSNGADEGKLKIEKFNGEDFGFWKIHIEDYLYQKNLYLSLNGVKPDSMKDEEWNLLDRKSLGFIRLSLSHNVAFNIAKEKTTTGLMKALANMYEKLSASNKCNSALKDQEAKVEANVASSSGNDVALICSLESKDESWVLDSGASFHATSQKELFEKYVSKNLGKVYLGDDQPCDIVGKGVVKIQLNGSVWELKNVRHIPNMRKNLILVGHLASEGYTTTFHGDDWKIAKGCIGGYTKKEELYQIQEVLFNHGIRMERTVASTPQHNSVAERMNITLTERARSMRMQSGLPKHFWAETVNATAYLINRGRNKLDPKSKKCTFLGYGEDDFGYRIWDDENKKVIRSRDVIFSERVMYKDKHTADDSN
ncbi:aluminum-activated malate transporter 8-like [Aristolochia californica]|uniref:aluminum-activated malate transporter 8-like n=1 Tax=Aristolochia californica TaxID=171875 RepID=UPI0035DF80CB